jgi:hypothetical protein
MASFVLELLYVSCVVCRVSCVVLNVRVSELEAEKHPMPTEDETRVTYV